MIAEARMTRLFVPSTRENREHGVAPLIAFAALDAFGTGILLLGTRLPSSLEGLAAATSHVAAVLLLSGLTRVQPSRRWLCVAAVLAVPLAGAAVGVALFATRGRGSTPVVHRRRARRRPALTMTAMRRLGNALSPCDALDCGDEEQRRDALVKLSRRRDPEAIALLRRGAAGRDPDLALSAALVLDEIGERAEREGDRLEPVEIRHGAG